MMQITSSAEIGQNTVSPLFRQTEFNLTFVTI